MILNKINGKKPIFLLGGLSALIFIGLLVTSFVKPYGFFIDELYFMSCSKRLAWGYIDQPPLSIGLLSLMMSVFGKGIYVVRILPALSMGATAFVTGLLARRLGGGTAAMIIAALAIMVTPVFQIFGTFYSMNAFEPLIWTLAVYFTVRMIQENEPRYWLHIGILSGLGLEMKHTFALYGVALLIGLLLTNTRKFLFSRWLLWGGLACFLLILPNLIWQMQNGFPSLELYNNSYTSKNIDKSYFQVFAEQVLFMNPATLFLWLAGLITLIGSAGKPYRFMFFAYLFLLLVILYGHSSRPDRISSIYTFLFAWGATVIDTQLSKKWKFFVQGSLVGLLLACGIILMPVFCPVLKPESYRKYSSALGLKFSIEEGKKDEPIPQWLADRIGWRELAAQVAGVYSALPEEEQINTVIVSTNYGIAGAMEYYGPEYGLPRVYATHNSFHSWGPPPDSVRTIIGVDIDDGGRFFESTEEAGLFICSDCTGPQQMIPIYVLRNPLISVEKEWESFKVYQ